MAGLLSPFFDGSYAPHGYCLLWQPELIWTHVIADSLIALAYFSIPVALISFVRRRRDMAFSWIFWLFALFIMACGATHVMSIWTLWNGNYGWEAMVKVVTALASVATAIVLWPLIPKALALPSPDSLRAVNADLERMVRERDAAIAELQEQSRQRARAEEALVQSQKLEAVGQLTGGIAHDFNNLLQAIAGSLELIIGKPGDENRVIRWCQNALRAVDSGKSLTGQLLAFSRVQQLALTPTPISPMIEGMSDLIQRSIGPMIRLEIASETPTNVIADRTQLELAILNLAINARDAMPDGGRLRIATTARTGKIHTDLPEGDYLEIAVEDTGHGMSAEVRERALEPFFTTKGVGKGTGLGLSMVFGIVTQSGGAMSIESTPGQGTVVRLLLKQAPAQGQSGAMDGAFGQLRAPNLDGRTILVIDDDDRVREVMADALGDAGARIVTAPNGEAGLALLGPENPDLVVVDFAMPGINGAEVARRARDGNSRLPVLIVSGFAESASLTAVTGPDVNLLRKPFRNTELLQAAERLLTRNAA